MVIKRTVTAGFWVFIIWVFADYGYLVKTKDIIEIQRYCSAQHMLKKTGNTPGGLPVAKRIRVRAWPIPAYEDIYYRDGCSR